MSKKKQKPFDIVLPATMHLVMLVFVIVCQVVLAAIIAIYLESLSFIVLLLSYLLALIACIYVYYRHDNPSTRYIWAVVIAFFPAFGLLLYALWGSPRRGLRKHRLPIDATRRAIDAVGTYANACQSPKTIARQLKIMHPAVHNNSRFLSSLGFLPFAKTRITYFATGEAFFDDALRQISQAKECIFLSFFILRAGKLWDKIEPLLIEKAAKHVDVRLLIDDVGTMFSVGRAFIDELASHGIRVARFNPVKKHLSSLYLNYRNHQKIIVIDGKIAYTGGVNIADEYVNAISPYGYWKDTGIRLEGPGAFGLTANFLYTWDIATGKLRDDYKRFYPKTRFDEAGFCQPFFDGPINNPDNPAEGLIFRMIESAHHYVFLCSPYLAVSGALIHTICRVARSGVRVVLLVPARYDHWYVYEVTQSHFATLMRAGVEVYRYTPGMLHAKMIVADDEHALVGTINLDNRSFYSQHENGVWFCGQKAVHDVRSDFNKMIKESARVTFDDLKKTSTIRSFVRLLLRLFSPLM